MVKQSETERFWKNDQQNFLVLIKEDCCTNTLDCQKFWSCGTYLIQQSSSVFLPRAYPFDSTVGPGIWCPSKRIHSLQNILCRAIFICDRVEISLVTACVQFITVVKLRGTPRRRLDNGEKTFRVINDASLVNDLMSYIFHSVSRENILEPTAHGCPSSPVYCGGLRWQGFHASHQLLLWEESHQFVEGVFSTVTTLFPGIWSTGVSIP